MNIWVVNFSSGTAKSGLCKSVKIILIDNGKKILELFPNIQKLRYKIYDGEKFIHKREDSERISVNRMIILRLIIVNMFPSTKTGVHNSNIMVGSIFLRTIHIS